MHDNSKPIIVGITGASGTIYGLRLIQVLLENNYKVELVFSESAIKVAKSELNLHLSTNPEVLKQQVETYGCMSLKTHSQLNIWSYDDIAASISSGSYKTKGMIIIPASMGSISAVANGTSDNLITRAADVCIKEKRKLVLVPREMPFSTIHLENMFKLSQLGVTIAPACPAFYHNPEKLDDQINFVIGKVLDLFEIEHNLFKRWKKESKPVSLSGKQLHP